MKTTPPPVRYGELAPSLPDGPVDLPGLIEGDGPLELDIGFGRGRSFLERARRREGRLVGIEIKAKWAFLVEERRARDGLTYARALCGDARELLARSGPDGCVGRVFVHFPDPWWKKRHTKRMVVTDAFLETLARLLEVGGELYVQTDVEERADAYAALIEAHSGFGAPERLAENPFAKSNREVRAEEDGLPVFRVLARRV